MLKEIVFKEEIKDFNSVWSEAIAKTDKSRSSIAKLKKTTKFEVLDFKVDKPAIADFEIQIFNIFESKDSNILVCKDNKNKSRYFVEECSNLGDKHSIFFPEVRKLQPIFLVEFGSLDLGFRKEIKIQEWIDKINVVVKYTGWMPIFIGCDKNSTAQAICKEYLKSNKAINLIGKTSLLSRITLLQQSNLLIGCGPTAFSIFATMLKIPTVAWWSNKSDYVSNLYFELDGKNCQIDMLKLELWLKDLLIYQTKAKNSAKQKLLSDELNKVSEIWKDLNRRMNVLLGNMKVDNG